MEWVLYGLSVMFLWVGWTFMFIWKGPPPGNKSKYWWVLINPRKYKKTE